MPTYNINSVSSSGKLNLIINAGNDYKNYYFEVYVRYDDESVPFIETGPKKYGTSIINLSFTRSEFANGGQFAINIGMRETESGTETYLGKKSFSTALLEYYNESNFFTDDFYVSLNSLKPIIEITELVPTRSGYVFNDKWRVQSGSTSQVGSSFPPGQSSAGAGGWPGGYYKLKAEWLKINSLTLNYNANGGVFSNGKTTYQDYQESETATSFAIVIYNAPTREGYNFLNWKVTSGPDKVNNTYLPGARGTWSANDTPYTLIAQWEEIPSYKITFTFTTNGGKWADGTTTSKTVTYYNYDNDQVAIKMLAAPTTPPTGQIFYYWQVSAGPDRIGDQYAENATGTWTGSLTGKSYTLKATWTTPGSDGVVYVNGKVCIPYIYTGSSWKECEAWIYANGKWNLCIE